MVWNNRALALSLSWRSGNMRPVLESSRHPHTFSCARLCFRLQDGGHVRVCMSHGVHAVPGATRGRSCQTAAALWAPAFCALSVRSVRLQMEALWEDRRSAGRLLLQQGQNNNFLSRWWGSLCQTCVESLLHDLSAESIRISTFCFQERMDGSPPLFYLCGNTIKNPDGDDKSGSPLLMPHTLHTNEKQTGATPQGWSYQEAGFLWDLYARIHQVAWHQIPNPNQDQSQSCVEVLPAVLLQSCYSCDDSFSM